MTMPDISWGSFACAEDGLIHAGRSPRGPHDPSWRLSWPWFACGLSPTVTQPRPEEMLTCLGCIANTARIP